MLKFLFEVWGLRKWIIPYVSSFLICGDTLRRLPMKLGGFTNEEMTYMRNSPQKEKFMNELNDEENATGCKTCP